MSFKCKSCGVDRPTEAYAPYKNNRLKHRYKCKECMMPSARAGALKHYNTPLNWTTRLRNKALQRSRKLNLEFTLTKEYLYEKILDGHCEVTGVPLDFSGGVRKPYTPSLDRIIPELGYVPGNVQLVCWIYNSAKSTFTHADVVAFAKLITKE